MLAAFFLTPVTSGGAHRRVRWVRLLVALLAFAVLTYVALRSAVFAIAHYHRGMTATRLVDALIPSRWSKFVAAQGHHLIVDATNHIQRGERREALLNLRAGLTKFPSHRAGRLLLARLEAEAGRAEAARRTLLDGLVFHAADEVYLAPLLAFLLEQQHDEDVVAVAERLLPAEPSTSKSHRVLALAAAIASFARGHYDSAERFLARVPQLATSGDGRLLAARIDWERGYRELALLRLRALVEATPDDARLQQELITRLHEVGFEGEARRRTIAFRLAHPDVRAARFASLRLHQAAGEIDRTAREVDGLLRDFPDAGTLLGLSEFAANVADVGLSLRMRREAEARGFPVEPHAWLMVECLLNVKNYRGALEALRPLQQKSDLSPTRLALLNGLQALAYQGLGETDTARVFLAHFLLQPSLRGDNLLVIANRFLALDAPEQALQILERAVVAEPANQAALTRLIEVQLNLNRIDQLPGHLQRLLTMRKPSPDLLRVARHKLGSDLFLFSPEAEKTLQAIREALDATARARPRA